LEGYVRRELTIDHNIPYSEVSFKHAIDRDIINLNSKVKVQVMMYTAVSG